MKTLKHILNLMIISVLVIPHSLAQSESPTKPQVKSSMAEAVLSVDQFIADFQKSAFVPLLAGEELTKALATYNIDLLMTLQVDRVAEVYNGPEAPEARFTWSESRAAMQARAGEVAKKILAQKIEYINLTLLSLLHRYLFADNEREAINYIFDGLYAYRFSPEELYRIRKEADVLKQASDGSFWAVLGVGLFVAARGGKKYLPQIFERLAGRNANKSAAASKSTGKIVAHSSPEAAVQSRRMTVDELIADIEGSGLIEQAPVQVAHTTANKSSAVASAAKSSAVRIIGNLAKLKFFAKIGNLLTYDGLKRLALATGKNASSVVGVMAAGAAANVGLNALANAAFPESFTNTTIDFSDLRENFYDGITVLRLSCLSHDYLERVSEGTAVIANIEVLRTEIAEMNALYTEFELLKRINVSLVDVTRLSSEIQVDGQTGRVTFNRNLRGQNITEEFECARLKGSQGGDISVSLNEVLVDIVAAGNHMTKLAENEKRAKSQQDKRTVVPGQAQ